MLEGFLSRKRSEMVNRLIPGHYRKGRIMDLWCGEYPYFLINTQFNEKYGVDRVINEEAFSSRCHKGNLFIKRCEITVDFMKSFSNDYFDVVTILAVFEHLDKISLSYIISEIRRVLKPEGIFILTTPAPWTSVILQILAKIKLVNPALIKEHKTLYNVEEIITLLIENGFLRKI